LEGELIKVKGNLSIIKEMNFSLLQRNDLRIPSNIQEISKIDSFSSDLVSSLDSLRLVTIQTQKIKSTVDDSVKFARNSLNSVNTTLNIIADANETITKTLKSFDLNSVMNVTNEKREEVINGILIIQAFWTTFISIIYVSPFFILGWGGLTILINKKPFQYFMKW
jgi:hypothetical protein